MGFRADIVRPIVNNSNRSGSAFHRRGLTVVELALAFTLLALVLAASVQMTRVVSDQRRAGERRDAALQAAQVVTEQVGNIPWDQLTADALHHMSFPMPLADRLPDGKLAITAIDETSPIAKRVQVEVQWSSRGKPTSVRLTSWVFPE